MGSTLKHHPPEIPLFHPETYKTTDNFAQVVSKTRLFGLEIFRYIDETRYKSDRTKMVTHLRYRTDLYY